MSGLAAELSVRTFGREAEGEWSRALAHGRGVVVRCLRAGVAAAAGHCLLRQHHATLRERVDAETLHAARPSAKCHYNILTPENNFFIRTGPPPDYSA